MFADLQVGALTRVLRPTMLVAILLGVVGAGIAVPHAGEQIGRWGLASGRRLRLRDVAAMIAPYPTFGEASKRAAGAFYADRLFSPWTRRLVRLLRIFG